MHSLNNFLCANEILYFARQVTLIEASSVKNQLQTYSLKEMKGSDCTGDTSLVRRDDNGDVVEQCQIWLHIVCSAAIPNRRTTARPRARILKYR